MERYHRVIIGKSNCVIPLSNLTYQRSTGRLSNRYRIHKGLLPYQCASCYHVLAFVQYRKLEKNKYMMYQY